MFLDELKGTEAEATPGPWTIKANDSPIHCQHGGFAIGGPGTVAFHYEDANGPDEQMVCILRNAVPAIIALLGVAPGISCGDCGVEFGIAVPDEPWGCDTCPELRDALAAFEKEESRELVREARNEVYAYSAYLKPSWRKWLAKLKRGPEEPKET